MALNKHQIFASNDLKESFVEVPEWGGKVKIRALSSQELFDYNALIHSDPSGLDLAMYLITTACIDDNGNKLFTEQDIPTLKTKNNDILFRIVDGISALSKQNPNDVDELAKNS
jgi:hypothetical protein